MKKPTILITGAGGYIGTELIKRLLGCEQKYTVVAMDVRPISVETRLNDIVYEQADIRDQSMHDLFEKHKPSCVVHLASVVSAGGDEALDYSIDVLGTENVLKACVAHDVEQIIVTSSGAAYGYHSDNPEWLKESDELRGNDSFAYSRHKRMVEELLADYRKEYPCLKQLVLRPCTVLGKTTDNQITALFEKPFVLNIAKSCSSFVFIWDQDVLAVIEKGIIENRQGIYNLAGSGALDSQMIAGILGKKRLTLPAWFLRGALRLTRLLGLGKLGPEHVKFIQYRPVLDNKALIEDFGYRPQKTSRETFEYFLAEKAKRI